MCRAGACRHAGAIQGPCVRPVLRVVAHGDHLSISLAGGASVAPIVAWLVYKNVAIEEVRKARATLEDAFLDLMGLETGDGDQAGGPT